MSPYPDKTLFVQYLCQPRIIKCDHKRIHISSCLLNEPPVGLSFTWVFLLIYYKSHESLNTPKLCKTCICVHFEKNKCYLFSPISACCNIFYFRAEGKICKFCNILLQCCPAKKTNFCLSANYIKIKIIPHIKLATQVAFRWLAT